MSKKIQAAIAGTTFVLLLGTALFVEAQNGAIAAHDPGARGISPGAGQPLSMLSAAQLQFFQDGFSRFTQLDSVRGTISGEPGSGLGPGFNSSSCASCHAQPSVGGSSPAANYYPNIGPNPQIQAASDAGATNQIPFFITAGGPVREARFPFKTSGSTLTEVPDGGVHDVFTIMGRSDAAGCTWVSQILS